jgi:aspartyl-tRNA(Asn)/glutamyl-tRNA(Gln) amidotransferase subunit C
MLDRDTVEKVSKLARLKLNEVEIAAFAEQLSSVLANFESIAQVDTAGVRPLITPTDMSVQLRPDDTVLFANEAENEKLLENAPEKMGRLFKVPPVV